MAQPAIKDGVSQKAGYDADAKGTASTVLPRLSFDTNDPVFMAQLKRDMEAIRNDPEEIEIAKFIEAVAAWPADDE